MTHDQQLIDALRRIADNTAVIARWCNENRTTPNGTPICPKHGVPMTKREKQGDVWYSHNTGTAEHPLYCRGRRGNDSPGWSVGGDEPPPSPPPPTSPSAPTLTPPASSPPSAQQNTHHHTPNTPNGATATAVVSATPQKKITPPSPVGATTVGTAASSSNRPMLDPRTLPKTDIRIGIPQKVLDKALKQPDGLAYMFANGAPVPHGEYAHYEVYLLKHNGRRPTVQEYWTWKKKGQASNRPSVYFNHTSPR